MQGLQRTEYTEVEKQIEKKPYLIQVSLKEARNLKSTRKSGLVNCYAMITVANGIPQTTNVEEGVIQAQWAQSFTFNNVMLTDTERDQFEITLEIFDHSDFWKNNLIGSASIGLGFLYNQQDHELFNRWISIKHPENTKNEATGLVKLSCYIITVGDEPPNHPPEDDFGDDDDFDEFAGIDDIDLKPEQLLQKKQKAQNFSLMQDPMLYDTNYQLMVNCVMASDLRDEAAFLISVRVQNFVNVTQASSRSRNPKFNLRFTFPITLPLLNDKIILKLWKQNTFKKDIFYANIPENPFTEHKFHINFLQSTGGNMPYTWINLYGIPENEREGYWAKYKAKHKRQKFVEGTDYLGRVLLSMVLLNHEKPEQKVSTIDGFNEPEGAQYHFAFSTHKLDIKKEERVYV